MDIKNIRKQTGLSQKKFAEKIGVPVRTLQGWEQGYRNPPDYIMNMISSVLSRNDLVDQYGNNTNFSDFIMSDITTKGLLGGWVDSIYDDMLHALQVYHMKTNNTHAGNTRATEVLFNYAENKITYLTPVFESIVNSDIRGIEDVFIAIYGIASDEVYVLRAFLKENNERNVYGWDINYMWDDCMKNERLREILTENAVIMSSDDCANDIQDESDKNNEKTLSNTIDIRFHTDFLNQNDLANCKVVFKSYSDIECTELINGSCFETTLDDYLGWAHYQLPVLYKDSIAYIQLDLMNEQDNTVYDTFYFMFKKAYQKHSDIPNTFVVEDGWVYELHPKTKIQRHRTFKQILSDRTYRTNIIVQTHVDYCE